jgi:hypothetical protein
MKEQGKLSVFSSQVLALNCMCSSHPKHFHGWSKALGLPSTRLCFCAWGGIPQHSIATHEIMWLVNQDEQHDAHI